MLTDLTFDKDSLSALISLSLTSLPSLQTWTMRHGAGTSLSELKLESCTNLTTVHIPETDFRQLASISLTGRELLLLLLLLIN